MLLIKQILLVFIGAASGVVISAGFVAFVSGVGLVPRMANKTNTKAFIPLYEDVITLGSIFGTTTLFIDYYLPIGTVCTAIFAFFVGIFIGCLAISLAEVLNVMPIFFRRTRMTTGIAFAILAIALGKTVGSLLYYLVEGFYIL